MRFQGRIKNWNDDKGFGFVEPNGGGNRSFVHIKSFHRPSRRPVEGDIIVYEQVKDAKGKFKALNIRFARERRLRSTTPRRSRKLGSVISASFWLVLITTTLLKQIPVEVIFVYIAASVVAYIFYAIDKSSAQNGSWRTPESHLHLISLVGGWPGAFYAQNTLKHKSSKEAFKTTYWVTVCINIAVFIWLLSEQGTYFLTKLLG